VSTQCLIFNY